MWNEKTNNYRQSRDQNNKQIMNRCNNVMDTFLGAINAKIGTRKKLENLLRT